jgi:diguanylate cyclase (GGDEF)-like protein
MDPESGSRLDRFLGALLGLRALGAATTVVVLANMLALALWAPELGAELLLADATALSVFCFLAMARSLRLHAELVRSRERFRLALRGARDGLWDWDVASGRVRLDARGLAMLDYPEVAVEWDLPDWLSHVHPEDVEALRTALDEHAAGTAPRLEQQYRVRDAIGDWRWVLLRGMAERDASGRALRVVGSQMDISDWKREQARLVHDALHDPLTGLPNRALFLDRLERVSEHGRRRAQYHYAVLFLDLDRFKIVNDGLGHHVGDELLKVVARRLLLCVRQEDTVARLGGDEFGILLADARDMADATRVAERINAALLQPARVGEHEVFTSVSIGVALSPAGYAHPDDVMRDADAAMYRAKAAGGMRYEIEGGLLHTRAVEQLRIEMELRRSVERGELRIQFQPIVELVPSRPNAPPRLMGLEALLRWEHPERGLLMPGEFIPVAEETGVILALDWWTLGRACEHAARWSQALSGTSSTRPIAISVNLSGKHFWHEDFIPRLDRLLAATGARPEHLRFDIAESAVLRDTEGAGRIFGEVRRRGIRLAIDDFGTGYSSLTYLQHFPIDAVKIDRSFVSSLADGPRSADLIRSILALARALGLEAVAEGVETAAELQELSGLGCELAQGYLFSHPLDAAEAGALLRSRAGLGEPTPAWGHHPLLEPNP